MKALTWQDTGKLSVEEVPDPRIEAPTDTTTRTPFASSPAPGSTSSDTAGRTTPPTTPRSTGDCNA